MIKIDLESAFHHIKVDPEFQSFLGFTHNNKFYKYIAMCFGVKHAPVTFHKTLRPVIKLIRELLQIRGIVYCDDLIFFSQNKQELENKKESILRIIR
jgi:hypothetical protein